MNDSIIIASPYDNLEDVSDSITMYADLKEGLHHFVCDLYKESTGQYLARFGNYIHQTYIMSDTLQELNNRIIAHIDSNIHMYAQIMKSIRKINRIHVKVISQILVPKGASNSELIIINMHQQDPASDRWLTRLPGINFFEFSTPKQLYNFQMYYPDLLSLPFDES